MLKMKKCHFSSLQTILNSRAEYPLKTDISVGTFNKCLIEYHCLISKFYSQNYEIESLIQPGNLCAEGAGLVAVTNIMLWLPSGDLL